LKIKKKKTILNPIEAQKKATPGAIRSSELRTQNTFEFHTRLNTPSRPPKIAGGQWQWQWRGLEKYVGFVRTTSSVCPTRST